MDARTRFREQIARDEIVIAAGAHDPLSARIAERVGFELVYMTGWGTSAARTGLPDAGLWTMSEMADVMSNVADVVDVPVFADADDGFGDALNVVRTTKKCIKSGIAGIHIEDEVPPKPLGPGAGVLPRREAVGKVRAATETRDELDEEFVVIARTNEHKHAEGSVDEAIQRLNEYYDAGADMVTLTMDDRPDYERAIDEVNAPILVTGNFVQLEPDEFAAMGVDVLMYPTASIWAAMIGMFEQLTALSDAPGRTMSEMEETLRELPVSVPEMTGYDEHLRLLQRYMPDQLEAYGSFGENSVLHSSLSDFDGEGDE